MNIAKIFTSISLYSLCIACFFTPYISGARTSEKISYSTPTTGTITISIEPEAQEIVIASSIILTAIDADITVGKYSSSIPSKTIFDDKTKQDIEGFSQPFTLSANFTRTNIPSTDTKSTVSLLYLTNNTNTPQQYLFSIEKQNQEQPITHEQETPTESVQKQELQRHSQQSIGIRAHIAQNIKNIAVYSNTILSKGKDIVSKAVEHTASLPIRLLFVYLLGLLMSLTPCIYPMIPITMGVLQASKQSSLLRNFLLASIYTAGLATTFAMLGLLAAYGGSQFGALLGNPWFVAFLVAFFVYLALAMFGFYEIQMPSFLRSSTTIKGGGYLSAFFFGAFGGTIASPCVSPGLMLLLGMVAALKSSILGFVYLFLFGCGIGTPLLILGTFSNTLSMAPRAGMWMLEIKKIFGILLLIMAINYAAAILPPVAIYAIHTVVWITLGIYYLATIRLGMNWYSFIVGTLLLCASGLSAFTMIKHLYAPKVKIHSEWITNYQEAKTKAMAENKKLLIKFGARWCSACTALGKRFNDNKDLVGKLDMYVLCAIDCTQQTDTIKEYMKKFEIKGLPAMLIIDPTNESVINRFGSELLEKSDDKFIETLRSCCKEVHS